MTSRRHFIQIAACSGAALAAGASMAADPPTLDEKDPQAVALGYVADTTKANKAKYPNHAPTQMCQNCSLWQGKAGAANGPCPIFGGKLVSAKGWCSTYVKKA